MNMRDKIADLLERIPQTRENDNLLIAYFLKDEYHIQNTFDVALQFNTNVYESVRRARQKIQETNPQLRPAEQVYRARLRREAEIRDEMRGV